jgi:hypothetical protein
MLLMVPMPMLMPLLLLMMMMLLLLLLLLMAEARGHPQPCGVLRKPRPRRMPTLSLRATLVAVRSLGHSSARTRC